MESVSSAPKTKYKTFTYHTKLHWLENRAGQLNSEGKPGFRVASPPEFKGEAGVWTPEDLFVAAVEACTMTTFLAFSSRQQIPLVSYESSAEGFLEFADGGYRFTKVIVRPKVTLENEAAIAQAQKTMDDAHHNCLITNSIKSEVVIEAEFKIKKINQ
jgi:organic hydroperoxide reductase OsmC/OhrA